MNRIANPVQTGEVIDYTNSGADPIAVGDIVVLTTFCGIAETNIPVGEMGAIAITKVWDVPSVSGTVFAVGDVLYWDAAAKKATKTATNNTRLGVCVASKASGSTRTQVKIGVVCTGA